MANPEMKQIMHGIQLVLEELRELRRESAEDRKQAAQDRKEAAEDRQWLRDYLVETRREQRQRDRVITRMGNTLIGLVKENLQVNRESVRLLGGIARGLNGHSNGRGNGRTK